jgi:hypothetical protein
MPPSALLDKRPIGPVVEFITANDRRFIHALSQVPCQAKADLMRDPVSF